MTENNVIPFPLKPDEDEITTEFEPPLHIKLSDEAWDRFEEMLNNPPKPTPALLKLLGRKPKLVK